MKIISWEQLKTILNNISTVLNRIAGVVKTPTGANQTLVTDENGQSKWVKRTHWEVEKTGWLLENYYPQLYQNGEFDILTPFSLTAGESYDVVFNGVEYLNLVAQIVGSGQLPTIGNINEEDDGPPFVIQSFPYPSGGWYGSVFSLEGLEEVEVSVRGRTFEAQKIPVKYIPVNEIMTNDNLPYHIHTANEISSGTFRGNVFAGGTSQAPATSLLRNSKLVSKETTPSYNGEIYWTYE